MKKIILLLTLGFVVLSSLSCLAEMALEKNPDGSYLFFEKSSEQSIPPLPLDIILDNEQIINLKTKGGTEEVPVKETKLISLFPLPTKKKTITQYSISLSERNEWDVVSLSQVKKEKIDVAILIMLIAVFISILTKTFKIGTKSKEEIKINLLIDSLLLLCVVVVAVVAAVVAAVAAAGAVAAAAAGAGAVAVVVVVAGIDVAAVASVVVLTAGIIVTDNPTLIFKYTAFLFCSILLSYLLLYFWNKIKNSQREEKSIQV